MKTVTRCPKNRDENALFLTPFVTVSVTSLFYHIPSRIETGARTEGGACYDA